MKLSEWVWLGAGTLITLVSGYIYFFIPKNGKPNTAMALFFFIGIIFIAIGITKLFFKRADDKSVLDSIKDQPEQQKTITIPTIESRPNRVDEEISKMWQQTPQAPAQTQNAHVASHPQHHVQHTPQVAQQHGAHMSHTNTFSQTHRYSGPVKTSVGSPNAQHPVAHHTTPSSNHPTHIQNTTEHSIKCGKCGNANSGHSNYCHKCGNRLK